MHSFEQQLHDLRHAVEPLLGEQLDSFSDDSTILLVGHG
jgi:hypothetical protein